MGATAGGVLDVPDLSSRSAEAVIRDHLSQGRDGSIDEDGRIVAQTIHYTAKEET